jgi:hypothetical protein
LEEKLYIKKIKDGNPSIESTKQIKAQKDITQKKKPTKIM